MIKKTAETSAEIHALLANRWSGRAYDPNRPVAENALISLFEAIRWSPSCFGDEPWRFIVCNKASNPQAWDKAFDCLAEGNQSWAVDAPVLMLGMADSVLSKTGKPNRWGQFDTGAASMSLCLQATELGLMVHQMGGYDPDKARSLFAIPKRFTLLSMIALGYQLPLASMTDEQKQRETAPRQRSPLQDKFFDGAFGNPIQSLIST